MLRRFGAFSLGRLFGIPIFVDYTWLFIFVLVTVTMSQDFSRLHADWLPVQHWVAGVATSLVFFLCVFLHEMGHCLVALAFGLPVLSITLFIFGGVAQIKGEPRKPSHEFLIAIAGPLTSVALAAIFFLAAWAIRQPMLHAICSSLAVINTALAVFNMIPGFPLDGGRVLRSGVWRLTGEFERATRFAAALGSSVAYVFIIGGVYLAISVDLQGLWIACIGGFLLMAAGSSITQLATRRVLEELRASNIMERLPDRVSPAMSVQGLVEGPILRQGQNMFMVEDDGILRGWVTLDEVKAIPRKEWPNVPLQSIMIPAHDLAVVESSRTLLDVLETMNERGVSQLPVVEGDRIVGVITRDRLFRVLRHHLEFGKR